MGTEGKMEKRLAFSLSEDSNRRLDLLTVFGVLNGDHPTKTAIIERCIVEYFDAVYEAYKSTAGPDDRLLAIMEELRSRPEFEDLASESSDS